MPPLHRYLLAISTPLNESHRAVNWPVVFSVMSLCLAHSRPSLMAVERMNASHPQLPFGYGCLFSFYEGLSRSFWQWFPMCLHDHPSDLALNRLTASSPPASPLTMSIPFSITPRPPSAGTHRDLPLPAPHQFQSPSAVLPLALENLPLVPGCLSGLLVGLQLRPSNPLPQDLPKSGGR